MAKQVLLIEDNPSDQIKTSALFESKAFVVDVAENGEAGLKAIESKNFELFLVDLSMPGISGIEVIEKIRSEDNYKETPIIVTSGKNESRDIHSALKAGANNYLTKPIDPMVFDEKVKELFSETEDWREYELDVMKKETSGGFFEAYKILSISEIGSTIQSDLSLEIGQVLPMSFSISDQELLVFARVANKESYKKEFKYKLKFVGLIQQQRDLIRQLCMEVYRIKKQMDRGEL